MTYSPNPINAIEIKLTKEILELTELLAKNVHDIWAKQRMAEGWSYGPKRDDIQKEHPCLIPYEDLTEDEKKYDRNTVLETLRAIIVLGYRIEKKK